MSVGAASFVVMYETLDPLIAAVERLRDDWAADGVAEMSDPALVSVNARLGEVRRLTDAVHALVAAELAHRSRPELGPDSVAKKNGYRNAGSLIAATTGTTAGDAARLVAVGDATATHLTLTGEPAPPKHPAVADAVRAGRISTAAAAAIIALMDEVWMRLSPDQRYAAEQRLCAQAVGLPLDRLRKILIRAQAHLDPCGVVLREDELRAHRALHIFERDGLLHLRATLDAEVAAPVKTAIDALVAQRLAAAGDATIAAARPDDVDAPRFSIPRLQADALALLCAHALHCDDRDVPTGGATLIVRLTLEDLQSGTGLATIDGIDAPVSPGTARRLAADGGVIPWVLGAGSEVLDWGRERRLFTRAQRLALLERDGGCAMCGAPPGWARVHHRRFWQRDSGPTDLDNGVLLCDSCHHRVHDNGWEIRIDGIGTRAAVWFIPPPHVDPSRTPRLGGRRRHDYLAA